MNPTGEKVDSHFYEVTFQHKQYLTILEKLLCTMANIPLRISNKDPEEAAAVLVFMALISQIKLLGVYSTA